ncbi:hypothetical protein ABBQ32_004189 [Trebouxia sp. C0010 RCD-2024]
MAHLSQHEVEACRQTFAQYDRTGAGTVSTHEVPSILTSLGYYTTEEDVVAHTHQDDGEGSREIGLEDVLRLLESRKQHSAADTDDTDTVEAFVALGGKADRSGKVLVEKLRNTIKEFELTIDLDMMLAELDKEQTGSIDYKEFKSLLD